MNPADFAVEHGLTLEEARAICAVADVIAAYAAYGFDVSIFLGEEDA